MQMLRHRISLDSLLRGLRKWVLLGLVMAMPVPVVHALGNDPVAAMLEGVQRVTSGGLPGPLVVFGSDAFPVVVGADGQPVVAAADWGAGRVVVCGHGGFRGEARMDTPRLLANAAVWLTASRNRPTEQGEGSMRVWGASKPLLEALSAQGVQVQVVDGAWLEQLAGIDLLVIDTHQLTSDEDQQAVRRFVHDEGGGLLTSGLAWGWLQLNPGRTLQEHPGTRLLSEAGLAFADGTLSKDEQDGYVASPPQRASHALWALEALAEGQRQGDAGGLETAASVVAQGVRTLNGGELAARLRALLNDHRGEFDRLYAGMADKALTWGAHPLARLEIELFMIESFDAPPGEVVAHPSAAAFPGALPEGTPRESLSRVVQTTLPGWRCVGVFVPAGEVVRLRFARDWSGSGLVAQIGAHLDPASRGGLHRLPGVVRRFAVDAQEVAIASAVGGLLFLDVPKGFGAASVEVMVDGVVRAPHFVLGQTSSEEWDSLRHAPSPWAELESGEIALTLPSSVVRELEDPAALMEFWDEVVRAQGSLEPRKPGGMPDRQARFVPDVQVSWGYMYAPADRPLTVPVHSAKNMVNLDGLRTNTGGNIWGFFHELGHWHQNPMWTFAGTGEVTVNLFTLYAFDKVCGLPPGEARGLTPEKLLTQMRAHAEDGAKFEVWKRDPFLALAMYVQLQQEFGWEVYRDVFAEYRALPDSERPRSEEDKRDQWMMRMSERSAHNLGPFFEAWGVPTSEAARASIAHLPVWMPAGWTQHE
jgi:hypothetical protein